MSSFPFPEPGRAGERDLAGRDNAFGFIRLCLASMVILSHSTSLVDGGLVRDPLFRLFGNLSSGELAVIGFFVLSGYLVSASFRRSPRVPEYLLKRVLRIYPAFLVCSAACVLLLAPLVGGEPRALAFVRAIFLFKPEAEGAFADLPYADLNGAAWTIQYEFACYIGIIGLGLLRLLDRPLVLVGLLVAVLGANATMNGMQVPGGGYFVIYQGCAVGGAFLTGVTYRALQSKIPTGMGWLALPCLALCLLSPIFAQAGACIFGGYLIFRLGLSASGTVFSRINNRHDISYGLYLYAWPIEQTLIYLGISNVMVLFLVTWFLSAICGAASWFVVERPALGLLRRRAYGGQPVAG